MHSVLADNKLPVASYNGTPVSLTIVYRKGIVLDRRHSKILDGYDGNGRVSGRFLWAGLLTWLELRGVLETAHDRRGGEYREDWYHSGVIKTKLNALFDLPACGKYLVDQNYSTSKHHVTEAASTGGITRGHAITNCPHRT